MNTKNDLTRAQTMPKKKRFATGHWELTSMLLPGMILVFLFSYLPMAGLVVAFKNYKYNLGIFGSAWVGFSNFEYLIKSNTFTVILRNTLCYNLTFIALNVILGIGVALCMDRVRQKSLLKVFQSSMFLPYFLSWVVVSYISHAFLEYNTGLFNSLITFFGGEPVSFYSESRVWPFILTFFSAWKSLGFNALVYYGALLGIDSEIYEAAALDACGELKKIWYITLPHLRQTAVTLVLLAIGAIFRSDYGLFFYLPKDLGALYSTTDVLDTYILRAIRVSGSVGAASAAGFMQSVVGFIFVMLANYTVKKLDSDTGLF